MICTREDCWPGNLSWTDVTWLAVACKAPVCRDHRSRWKAKHWSGRSPRRPPLPAWWRRWGDAGGKCSAGWPGARRGRGWRCLGEGRKWWGTEVLPLVSNSTVMLGSMGWRRRSWTEEWWKNYACIEWPGTFMKIFVFTNICTNICVYKYFKEKNTNMYTNICKHICTNICKHIYTNMCTNIYTYICTHICKSMQKSIFVQIYMHIFVISINSVFKYLFKYLWTFQICEKQISVVELVVWYQTTDCKLNHPLFDGLKPNV